MNHDSFRFKPRTQFALIVGAPSILLSYFIMSPLFAAHFHPVDDHEFVAMLSLDYGSTLTRFYTRFFEMSPAAGYPESVHWRPAVWFARTVEVEIFNDRVALYFLWRMVLLAALGLFAAGYGRLVVSQLWRGRLSAFGGNLIAVFLGLLTISTPSLFDVFGRLLPGEMYTLLGLLLWAFAWSHLIKRRSSSLAPRTRYAACAYLGLVLMSTGKEDALFLWPLAVGFSLPEIRYFASQKFGRTTWTLVFASSLVWAAAMVQVVYTFIVRGNPLPYQSRSGSGLSEVLSALERIEILPLLGVLSSVLLCWLGKRCLQGGWRRLALFLSAVLLLEMLYVSTVPAEAPRYGSVLTVTGMLLLPLHGALLRDFLKTRGRALQSLGGALLLGCVLLVPLGAIHQRANITLYRDISNDWNSTVGEVADLADSLGASQILFVVDPPSQNEIGRWEKTYSFARFVRTRTSGQQGLFMTVMESTALNISSEARAGLQATSVRGVEDAAGDLFQPRNALNDSGTLCVLYSDSGRDFDDAVHCDFVYRLTL